ncbi:MAG TPA: hypothetical protein VF867_01210 [Arthrobacter sp.]
MSAVVVHTPQTLVSRLVLAAVFCVALNLLVVYLGFPAPIVATAQTLSEIFPPFIHSLQEAIGIIRTAASK